MAKEDFRSFMFRNVELKYPRLNQTHRYNNAEKRSEPCAQTANGASWSVAFEVDADTAKTMFSEMKAHYQSRNPKAPFSKVFGMKKLDSGMVEFRAKRNGANGEGKPNTPPSVIDGRKLPLEDKSIWSGSKGSVRVVAYPTTDPDGNGGISLILDVVQVTEAVYGGDNLDDFDSVEPAVSDLDDFDGPSADPKAKADLDDEIPW